MQRQGQGIMQRQGQVTIRKKGIISYRSRLPLRVKENNFDIIIRFRKLQPHTATRAL